MPYRKLSETLGNMGVTRYRDNMWQEPKCTKSNYLLSVFFSLWKFVGGVADSQGIAVCYKQDPILG